MFIVKKVTQNEMVNQFTVEPRGGGLTYDTTAERAAACVVAEIKPMFEDISAGLCFLTESLTARANNGTGELDQWQLKGVCGLLRGLETRVSESEFGIKGELAVLEAFGIEVTRHLAAA